MKKKPLETIGRDTINETLYRALRAVYQFERIEVREFDLTYPEIYLLKYALRNRPLTISDIAGELRLPLFGATRIVDRLEKKGLMQRMRNTADKRVVTIVITDKGNAMVEAIEDHMFATIFNNMQSMTEKEIKTIIQLAQQLEKILGVEKSNTRE